MFERYQRTVTADGDGLLQVSCFSPASSPRSLFRDEHKDKAVVEGTTTRSLGLLCFNTSHSEQERLHSVTCIKMKLNFTAFHFPSNLECPDTYQVWRPIFVSDKIHDLTGRHHCWLVSSRGTEPAIVGEGFSTWLPLGFHFLMRSFGGCLSKLVISQVGVCVAKY